MTRNEVKVKLQSNGTVTLKFVRRDAYGRAGDRFQITLNRRTLERALAGALIDVPWKLVIR